MTITRFPAVAAGTLSLFLFGGGPDAPGGGMNDGSGGVGGIGGMADGESDGGAGSGPGSDGTGV